MKTPVRTATIGVAILLSVGALTSCSVRGQIASNAARSQTGVRYTYGGASRATGFDCSGLTSWAWRQAGVSIPRTARQQYYATARISRSQLQPGDLVFYGYSGQVSHVAMYTGGGQITQARHTGTNVGSTSVDSYWLSARIGYGRVR